MSKRRKKSKYGFVPSIIEQANGRKRGTEGAGLGAHQETSPMARPTVTPSRRARQRKMDRQQKQRGWD